MNSKDGRDLVILAGPNGAGKSTVASFLLKNRSIKAFLNADIIASGISTEQGQSDIQAGRIMLESLWKSLADRRSVAFESTMSGRSWGKLLSEAKKAGYETTICYVAVTSPEIAVRRVEQRVSLGGHPIPPATVKRRFYRSLTGFFQYYSKLVDHWYFFDNSQDKAVLVALSEKGDNPKILYPEIFDAYPGRNLKSNKES